MIDDQTTGSRGQVGCLVAVSGVVLGLAAWTETGSFISGGWSYCMNMPWWQASDITDSPRFSLFAEPWLPLVYCAAFPLGFLLVGRLLRARGGRVRGLSAVVAGVLLLSAVTVGDLVDNVAPPHGDYLSARCAQGRPPSWPEPLPMRGSPYADFEHQG